MANSGKEQRPDELTTAPGRRPLKHLSRREILSRGLQAGAALTAVGWVRPTVSTVRMTTQAQPTPRPRGQPSVIVEKTVEEAIRDGSSLTVTGVITITDDSTEAVGFTIEEIRDVVEFKVGSGWLETSTTELVLPCPPGTQVPPEGSCSGDYVVQATIPPNASAARNVVHVKVFFREKDFLYRENFSIP